MLAQGGMGTVWVARVDRDARHLVALKTILPGHTGSDQFRAMFLDEARIASRIDHDNVARIFDLGEEHGFLYFAMEFIEGESLRRIHKDRQKAGTPFPLGCALRILADACAGLHAAHELCDDEGKSLEIVHRDVSPQNILVSASGQSKLIDFGVAKARDRLARETTLGGFKGKLDYMPIEQAQASHIDRRADVYAVGAILYELLQGHPPHDSGSLGQMTVLHNLALGVPYAPLDSSVPEPVVKLIERALSWKRTGRYPSCEALRQALEQAMIDCNVPTTADDVARMLNEYSGDREEKRKRTIQLALEAIDDPTRSGTDVLRRPIFGSRSDAELQIPPLPEFGATLTGSARPREQTLSGRKRRGTVVGAVAIGATLLLGTVLAIATRQPVPSATPSTASVTAPQPTEPPQLVSSASHEADAGEAPPPVASATAKPHPTAPRATKPPTTTSTHPAKPGRRKGKDPDVDYGF